MDEREGYPVCDWRVEWTTDGISWHERGFCAFTVAQGFARYLLGEHGGEADFSLSVSRMMVVNTTSLLDAACAGDVALAPHTLGTAKTFA